MVSERSTWAGQFLLGPSQQLRAEYRSIQDEPLRGVGGIVAGQGPDSIQPVGDCPNGEVEPQRGRRIDPSGGKVGLEGVEKRARAAARLAQRIKYRMDQVDDRRLIAEQDPIDQEILAFHDRTLQLHAHCGDEAVPGLLIGARDPVCTGVCPANGDTPRGCTS